MSDLMRGTSVRSQQLHGTVGIPGMKSLLDEAMLFVDTRAMHVPAVVSERGMRLSTATVGG
jgi:hypothetical protein